jgi:DNA-binding transcriptional ArsR family regulator
MASAKLLSGRPLYATAVDAELYVALPDVADRVERSLRRELNTLVIGERGSGKTSLLQHLLYRSREDASWPRTVYLDASIARSALDVVDLLREQLGVPPHFGENIAASLQPFARPGAAGARDATVLLQRIAPLRDVDASVVLTDGLLDADVAKTLFGRLRDELWRLPLTWVVTATPDQRAQFLAPPADAFFETVVAMRALNEAEQRDVLRRRLGDESRLLTALVHEAGARPRDLLAAAREVLIGGRAPEDVLEGHAARELRAASLGRSASMTYAELRSLGRPVAASDEELLQRLGVTRERASQVLKELEHAHLVESFTQPAERGRPRKLYRLVDAPVGEWE